MLAKNEDMYAYDFEGRRYDIGSKQVLQATVDFALSRDDLKDEFAEYLKEVTKIYKEKVYRQATYKEIGLPVLFGL